MEAFEILEQCICSRRTIRAFTNQSVDREKLEQILNCAGYAPSGMNNQGWHFLVVSGNSLEKLRICVRDFFRALELTPDMPPFFGVCKEKALASDEYSFFYGAPVLLIVTNKQGYRNAMADSAAATMNAMLTATSLGLATGWITTLSGNTTQPAIREILYELGMPDNYDVFTSMSIGYGAEKPEGSPRKYNVTWCD